MLWARMGLVLFICSNITIDTVAQAAENTWIYLPINQGCLHHSIWCYWFLVAVDNGPVAVFTHLTDHIFELLDNLTQGLSNHRFPLDG